MADVHPDDLLSIGQFAALTRLSLKALRLYDESGLLPAAHVDPFTGYRRYTPDQADRATLIGALRRVGVPLEAIRSIVDADREQALELFHDWWAREQRDYLNRRGLALYATARLSRKGESPMEIRTRVVPARTMAVISKELFQPEIDTFVTGAFTAIFEHLVAHGLRTHGTTPEEPTYIIFHGQVTPDLSARVDICVPFEGEVGPTADISIALEPEHHEAYTELTKAQMEFPQILHAYDAVGAWVHQHGEPTLPPREVYIAEWPEAGPDDHVVDVAFPYTPQA